MRGAAACLPARLTLGTPAPVNHTPAAASARVTQGRRQAARGWAGWQGIRKGSWKAQPAGAARGVKPGARGGADGPLMGPAPLWQAAHHWQAIKL